MPAALHKYALGAIRMSCAGPLPRHDRRPVTGGMKYHIGVVAVIAGLDVLGYRQPQESDSVTDIPFRPTGRLDLRPTVFTEIALDGPRLVWRMPQQCEAVPTAIARPAARAFAQLRIRDGRPVAFAMPRRGAVMLHPGAVPLGTGPGARVLAQACARLTPPSRLVSITADAGGPPLAATLFLPMTPAADPAATADWCALRALITFSAMVNIVDPRLLRAVWASRPMAVTSLLPALANDALLQHDVHACVLGLAAYTFGARRHASGLRGAAWA